MVIRLLHNNLRAISHHSGDTQRARSRAGNRFSPDPLFCHEQPRTFLNMSHLTDKILVLIKIIQKNTSGHIGVTTFLVSLPRFSGPQVIDDAHSPEDDDIKLPLRLMSSKQETTINNKKLIH